MNQCLNKGYYNPTSFMLPALGSVRQHIYRITNIISFLQNPFAWQLIVESHQQINLVVGATTRLLRSSFPSSISVSPTMHRDLRLLASLLYVRLEISPFPLFRALGALRHHTITQNSS
jgi:hypothetical protein